MDAVNVTVQGLITRNSPFWTNHIIYAVNVVYRNVTALAPRPVGNTDGLLYDRERKRERERDRQIDRETERQGDRDTKTETDKERQRGSYICARIIVSIVPFFYLKK